MREPCDGSVLCLDCAVSVATDTCDQVAQSQVCTGSGRTGEI